MGKTKRKKARQERKLRRENERRFEQEYQQRRVEAIRAEAEEIINNPSQGEVAYQEERQVDIDTAKAVRTSREDFSVSSPPYDDPVYNANLIWWTGASLDQYIPLSEYGDPKRQLDLAAFATVAPLLLNAEAVLVKKVVSLNWYVESGRNKARHWQDFFLNVEGYKGWDYFIAKLVRAYSESDRGVYTEIIRSAPSWAVDEYHQLTDRGEAAYNSGDDVTWPIVDLRVLDPIHCWPTLSSTWPLIYNNPHTGRKYQLRQHQFMHLLDMPTFDTRYSGIGYCAASRAVWAAQEHRMIVRYAMEKMSENPGAGIVTGNVNQKLLETALKSADTERQARGVVYYKGLIFLPVLDPSGRVALEFLNFSGLPDGFDRGQVYNICKEEVAAAYGIDVLELGSMPGNQLGSAEQATVMSKKSRGKGVGVIAQGVERQFRQRLLPSTVFYRFSSQDLEERMEKAEIDAVLFKNAAMFASQIGAPPELAMQYLIDTEAIPKEYLAYISGQDVTTNEIIFDTEAPELEGEKSWKRGDLVRVYKDGSIMPIALKSVPYTVKQVDRVVPDGELPPPLTRADAEVTPEDISRTVRNWDKRHPEYAGLLEATQV